MYAAEPFIKYPIWACQQASVVNHVCTGSWQESLKCQFMIKKDLHKIIKVSLELIIIPCFVSTLKIITKDAKNL